MPNPSNYGSDEDWETLLRQLRQQPRPQPRPFLHARVQARLAAQQRADTAWLPTWVRRPAYVVLLGALGLAVSGDSLALRPPTLASHAASYQPSRPAPPLPR